MRRIVQISLSKSKIIAAQWVVEWDEIAKWWSEQWRALENISLIYVMIHRFDTLMKKVDLFFQNELKYVILLKTNSFLSVLSRGFAAYHKNFDLSRIYHNLELYSKNLLTVNRFLSISVDIKTFMIKRMITINAHVMMDIRSNYSKPCAGRDAKVVLCVCRGQLAPF